MPLRKIINVFCFILCCHFAAAQTENDSLTTDVSLFEELSPLADKCQIFIDSNNSTNPAEILDHQWKNYSSLKVKHFIPQYWINKTLYLKFALQNTGEIADTIYFYPGNSFRSILLYKISATGALQITKDKSKLDGFQPIELPSNEKASFIAELHFSKRKFNTLNINIIQKNYLSKFQKLFYTLSYDELVAGYLLSGVLLMMIFYNAANFHIGRRKEFLYNCCYSICMFGLIFFNTYIERRSGVFASFFMGYLAFALLLIGTIFYMAFTRWFLNTKVNYSLLDKIFRYTQKGLVILLLGYSYIYFFTNNFLLQSFVENTTKAIVLAIGISYIIIGIKKNDKLFNYLVIGNAFLIFFSIISFLLVALPVTRTSLFSSALLYYEFGIVCEQVFFLLGLTYKNRTELIEKIKEQEALKLEAEKQIFETKLAVLNAHQEERNRISADMHDDLGAGVTAIRLFSELAKRRVGNDAVPEIEKISFSANELLTNMNTIIWTMNSSNDSFGNMVAYVRSYGIEYFENTGINCRVEIDKELPEFPVNGEIRRNVFLVVKEALNNVLKHAKATEVSLVLKKEAGGISLFIQDNGIGINFDNLRLFGSGLKNMKQRMIKSGIEFSIENKNGTLITLHRSLEDLNIF
jgi:signal transduction histidine kinase